MSDQLGDWCFLCPIKRYELTVALGGGHGAYGWCTIHEVWQGNGKAYREINICAEYIDRPIAEVAATMLHEKVHPNLLINDALCNILSLI